MDKIDPRHEQTRRVLRRVGGSLMVVGGELEDQAIGHVGRVFRVSVVADVGSVAGQVDGCAFFLSVLLQDACHSVAAVTLDGKGHERMQKPVAGNQGRVGAAGHASHAFFVYYSSVGWQRFVASRALRPQWPHSNAGLSVRAR